MSMNPSELTETTGEKIWKNSDCKIGVEGPLGLIQTQGDVKRARKWINEQNLSKKSGKPISSNTSENAAQSQQNRNSDSVSTSIGKKQEVHTATPSVAHAPNSRIQFDNPKKVVAYERRSMVRREKMEKPHPLFAHLAQYERPNSEDIYESAALQKLHSSIVDLGYSYASGLITGTSARTIALTEALLNLIKDFTPSSPGNYYREITATLNVHIRFLIDCRTLAIPMGNLIRHFKQKISTLSKVPDESCRAILEEVLISYKNDRIQLASHVLSLNTAKRINNGDVILVYSFSNVVEMAIIEAKNRDINFKVIVVDSTPKLEGQKWINRLVLQDIDCEYTLIHCAANVMGKATKVLLGASAMLSNGSLVARAGSAMIAMIAKTVSIPVIVCCETFKFSENVQLDSICGNEIGAPDELIDAITKNSSPSQTILSPANILLEANIISQDQSKQSAAIPQNLIHWRSTNNLKLLNITYDVTPIHYISCVITEVGIVPPTSVPVIIREMVTY